MSSRTETETWRSPVAPPLAPSMLERDARRSSPFAGARILVVDDDVCAREALVTMLSAQGYKLNSASDGVSALALARRWSPDLIITDLLMPQMCGHELCRRMHELDPDVPVIIVTSLAESESVLDCLSAGADDNLIKPLQLAAVSFGVHRALERRASKREREQLRTRTDELCQQLRKANERLIVSSIREQQLAAAEAAQRAEINALLEGLAEGIIIVDNDGCVRMMNRAARGILGVRTELLTVDALETLEVRNLLGQPLLDDERPLRRALRGDDFADYEIACLHPDGSERRIVTTATSVKDANGVVVAAIIALRDVTRLRRLEQQREEYIALISHDLRTPLGIVSMSARLLEASANLKPTGDDMKSVARIIRSSRSMATMLDELSDVTQLESQTGELRLSPCELGDIVADIILGLDEARARRVKVEGLDAGPFPILADVTLLERCITNLLTNAFKYSAADAPVLIQLSRTAQNVELCVLDHGIGISPESQKHIFNRYYRTILGRSQAEGLGLGLYIVRLIAESHKGQIRVSSELGVGSSFRLTLPLTSAVP